MEARDFRHVVLTHIHWDHVSGAPLFPNASFYVQEAEYRFWMKDVTAARPPFLNLTDPSSNAFLASLEGSERLRLLNGDRQILPGVECLLAPGHTVGLQVVAVDTERGTAILGSDSAHLLRNFNEDWPSSLITNMVEWMKSYDKIRGRLSSPELFFPGHDPLLRNAYPEVARDVTRLA